MNRERRREGSLGRQYAPTTDFSPGQGLSHSELMSGAQFEDPHTRRVGGGNDASPGRLGVQRYMHQLMRGSSNASSKLCFTQTDSSGLDMGPGIGTGTGTGINMDTGGMGTEAGMGFDNPKGMDLEYEGSALEAEMQMQLAPSWDTLLHNRLPGWSGHIDALDMDAAGHEAGFGNLEDAQSG